MSHWIIKSICSFFGLNPTFQNMVLLAGGGSATLLAGAYIFQMLGYSPCTLCYWQRWPHFAAIAIALIIIFIKWNFLVYGGALSVIITAVIGIFHSGVERGLWKGLEKCSGQVSALEELSGDTLLTTDIADNIVLCDEITWAFLGLSMANWNVVISCFIVLFWLSIAQENNAQNISGNATKNI